jgi:choline-glycine betaine transporter
MGKKFGFSFSWKRAVGISAAKGRISRKIGVPLTRSGRQRKVGRAAGCLVIFATIIGMPLCLIFALLLTGTMSQ